jgi:hypothetical protein
MNQTTTIDSRFADLDPGQFRIVIPAKGNSLRAPGKNQQLLPMTLDYVSHLDLLGRSWVMTDSPVISALAGEWGAHVLPEIQVGDDFTVNFTASYRRAGWDDETPIILLEPTKPLREEWLLEHCLRQHFSTGKTVCTGLEDEMTLLEWLDGRPHRRPRMKILDACVVVSRCGEFSKVTNMNAFWENQECEVVWHKAPTGIDFDWPVDLRTHLPTVRRLLEHGCYDENRHE